MPLPKIARIAAWSAIIVGACCLIDAFAQNILEAGWAIVFFAGGIGIFRRRVWGAYGLALLNLTQLPVTILWFSRTANPASKIWLIPGLIFTAAFVTLFFFAGRSLSALGANRGWRAPWIALSVVTAPLFALFQPFVIPTGTMENTLLVGDRIVVNKWPKSSFHRGDVAVLIYPVDRRQTFVKRIVGVAGDKIRMQNKSLVRNGETVSEPYAVHKTEYIDSYRDNFPGTGQADLPIPANGLDMIAKHVENGEVVVPANKYFVMGDNRDLSWDSRYFGFVDAGDLLGKPVLIYDSRKQTTEEVNKGKPAWSIRWERLFRML